MSKRTLKFLQYSIHAHLEEGNPDYPSLFHRFTELKGKYRKNGKRVIAIGTAMLTGGSANHERLSLVVYSGEDDQSILFFDINQQVEMSATTEAGRFVARKTYVLIDPKQRTLVMESGRGHPSAEEFAGFLEHEAQTLQGLETLDLSFTPVPTPTFAEKISGMQRIQAASVSLARPNVSWNDRYTPTHAVRRRIERQGHRHDCSRGSQGQFVKSVWSHSQPCAMADRNASFRSERKNQGIHGRAFAIN